MSEFLSICEYLGITPKDFFDDSTEEPSLIRELTNEAKDLQKEDLELLVSIARRLNGHNK